MDDFAIQLSTTDTKKKISVGQDIIDYLGQPDNPADCEDLGAFIDALVPWMTSSNFKVSWFNPDWRHMNHLIVYATVLSLLLGAVNECVSGCKNGHFLLNSQN